MPRTDQMKRPSMKSTALAFIKRIDGLMLLTVVFPTIIAIAYFWVFASDVYISESRFVVRSPDKPTSSGLGILLKSTGFTNAGEEAYAAENFVESRDALTSINKDGLALRAYTSKNISVFDRFNPIGTKTSFEDLFKYYQKKVSVSHDSTSSVTTLTVRAFTPIDAQRLNRRLLEQAESLVNRLNVRGRRDFVQFAQAEVEEAKNSTRNAAIALANFRNREGVVDPAQQAEVQLQMVSKIQDELIATRTQLAQLQAFTPQNPQVDVLRERVRTLNKEIQQQMGQVVGDRKSLAGAAVEYQRLMLESQFTEKQLAVAMTSLEEARSEARRKQAYVERIVQPNLPDDPLEPRRFRGVIATLVLGLVIWGVLSMLLTGIREHRD